MKDSCRSIIKAMGILDWLEECIEEIMKEWERFEGDNGDMQYFSHFDDEDDDASENLQRHIQRSLIAIKRELEDFSYLRRTLLRLQRYCRESSEDVRSLTLSKSHANAFKIKFWLKLRSDDAAVQTSEAAQRNIRYTAFMNMVGESLARLCIQSLILLGYHPHYARHHLILYAPVSDPIQTQPQVFRHIYCHHRRGHTASFRRYRSVVKLVAQCYAHKNVAGNRYFSAEKV